MQKHLALTMFGLAAGVFLLAWIEPVTLGGSTLLVVLSMAVFNTLGAPVVALSRMVVWRRPPSPPAQPGKAARGAAKKSRTDSRKLLAILSSAVALTSAEGVAQVPGHVLLHRVESAPVEPGKIETLERLIDMARQALKDNKPADASFLIDLALNELARLTDLPKSAEVRRSLEAARTLIAQGGHVPAERRLSEGQRLVAAQRFYGAGGLASNRWTAPPPPAAGDGQAERQVPDPRRGLRLEEAIPSAPPAAERPVPRAEPPPPRPTATPRRPLHPARTFLSAADIPPSNVGAYGVLALRAKPTPATQARLKAVCAAFLASLPAQESLPRSLPVQDRMLTVWPLATAGAPDAKLEDCDYLLQNYDLHGGISAIQDADSQGNELRGQGPYLIGWSPASSRRSKDAVVLVLDLSLLESQQSFNDVFLLWQRRIVEDPALWRTGFSSERLRLVVRDFVDRYGQAIVDSFKLMRTGGG